MSSNNISIKQFFIFRNFGYYRLVVHRHLRPVLSLYLPTRKVNRIVKKRAPRPRAVRGMHQQDFRQLKRTVAQEAFDKDRLQVLRFATKNNYLTSKQVAQLMDLLTFEKYKLTFAKFAYQSTVDKQNYFQVRNKLTFSSSRKKLIRFIETQPVRNRGGRRR